MSVAVKDSRARTKSRQPWVPPAFCEQEQAPATHCIVVDDADPLQSLTEAVRQHQAEQQPTVGSQLDAELDRISALTEQLRREVSTPILPIAPTSGPIDVPVGPPAQAATTRSTAREAWSAVVILVLFITAGFAWTTNAIQSRDKQVWTLQKLLKEKETALVSYQQQVKQLRSDLAQSNARLKAAEKQIGK
jgi:hypothetical protein